MKYLLDTNACIALLNHKPEPVRLRLEQVIQAGLVVGISSIVAFELWYGVSTSRRQLSNRQRLSEFFGGPVEILPFEQEDAEMAGIVRAQRELAGTPMGAYDYLIAGQALRHHCILVTSNVSEFSRANGLAWEDWAKP